MRTLEINVQLSMSFVIRGKAHGLQAEAQGLQSVSLEGP
jgi:hypothetical protein